MKNFQINNSSIIFITLCLLLVFVYGVIEIYMISLDSSKGNHQKKQSEIVKSARMGIVTNINDIAGDLLLYSRVRGTDELSEELFLEELWKDGMWSTFSLNLDLEITNLKGEPLPEWCDEELKTIPLDLHPAVNAEPPHYLLSAVLPYSISSSEENFCFLLIVDIGKSTGEKDLDGKFIGSVIDFNWLVKKYITPHKLTENDFVWILDGEGRLIYHPNHQEMLLRSTKSKSADCEACHVNFDVQNSMLIGEDSVGEYLIEGEPSKIMAYAPIEFLNQKWILAISTYLPYVVNDVRNSLLFVFTISALFISLLSLLGYMAYNINMKRIRAEESQKHLAQVQSFQDKLNHASKLASIGELVDSVAHEINTPAGIISSTADALLIEEKNNPNLSNDLKMIKDQTRRIGKYTKSLLAFSRRLPFQPVKNDIGKLIDECIFIVGPKLRTTNIKIVKDIPADFPEFVFDKGRMEQVMINLLKNAIDIVEINGQITISLEHYNILENNLNKNWVKISVADNGKGILPENIESIFEPFFSTKPLTAGTGLGLSISKAIVERHLGRLEVESIPGEGSKFIIHLPMI